MYDGMELPDYRAEIGRYEPGAKKCTYELLYVRSYVLLNSYVLPNLYVLSYVLTSLYVLPNLCSHLYSQTSMCASLCSQNPMCTRLVSQTCMCSQACMSFEEKKYYYYFLYFKFLYWYYYPQTSIDSVSPVCMIFCIRPYIGVAATPHLYPTQRKPSSLALEKLWDHFGATKYNAYTTPSGLLVCAPKLVCGPRHVCARLCLLVWPPKLVCAFVCAPKLICALVCAHKLICVPKLLCALICAQKLVPARNLVWALVCARTCSLFCPHRADTRLPGGQ